MSFIQEQGKNLIINGCFNYWQRGTSFVSPTTGAYTTDRFSHNYVGAARHTISQSSTVPTVAESSVLSNYSLRLNLTTVDDALAAGDYTYVQTIIEGNDFVRVAQYYPLTLSFWVRATTTGTYCCALGNSGSDRSYVKEYTINTTNTWEKKTVTFEATPSAGTWDYTNGIGLRVRWCVASGSTFQTTADAWQTGDYFATSSQVNGTATGSTDFYLAQAQLEAGPIATHFEIVNIATELNKCQRYYEKNVNLTTTPTDIDTDTTRPGNGTATAVDSIQISISYKVRKRAAPSITFYSDSGNTGTWDYYDGGWQADKAATSSKITEVAFTTSVAAAGLTVNEGHVLRGLWTAASEL